MTNPRWSAAVLASAVLGACAAVSGLSDYEIDDGRPSDSDGGGDRAVVDGGRGGGDALPDRVPDVPLDARPAEDSSIGAPGIHCGDDLLCAPDEHCCRAGGSGALCRKRGASCPDGYFSLRCDDSFDCDGGLCCAALIGTLFVGSGCQASSCLVERFCVSDRECDVDGGERCRARSELPPETYTCH